MRNALKGFLELYCSSWWLPALLFLIFLGGFTATALARWKLPALVTNGLFFLACGSAVAFAFGFLMSPSTIDRRPERLCDGNATDKVTAGTEAYPDRVFAHVAQWTAAGGTATITLSDHSEWILAGDERIHRHAPLLDLSRDNRRPLLLAADKTTRQIGMIYSTVAGVPEFYGETVDGRELLVSVPPSMRVFRLPTDRPWFDNVKVAITDAQRSADPAKPKQWWIAFDSRTSEIVDVRPATNGTTSGSR